MATVADFIVERLYDWSVRRVYGYTGDGINGLFGALGQAGGKIEFIQARRVGKSRRAGVGAGREAVAGGNPAIDGSDVSIRCVPRAVEQCRLASGGRDYPCSTATALISTI